jgi:hypothetical protein
MNYVICSNSIANEPLPSLDQIRVRSYAKHTRGVEEVHPPFNE